MITVQIRKDVCLISTTIDVELVEMPDKRMVSPWLRWIRRIEIDPFLLDSLELCQVIEVDATFASVATEEEDAVLEGERVGA